MDTTRATEAAPDLEVLTDDELAGVVGGVDDVDVSAVRDYAYSKIGMCGCGLAH